MRLHTLGVLMILAAAMTPGDAARAQQSTACVVSGVVTGVISTEKSPWDDGTPSTLKTTEVHLSLDLESRVAQRKAKDTAACSLDGATPRKTVTYKLCSPVQVKQGQRIKGVEASGQSTGKAPACLFDVAIMPDATSRPADAKTPGKE